MSTPLVRVGDVTKHYPGVRALTGASLEIAAGEVRALLGRNGAGKSTLIKVLSGVERPDAGTVEIAGVPLDGGVRHANRLGVQTVHQELSLVPGMTAAENLFLGTWPRAAGRVDHPAMRRAAREIFDRLGLGIAPDAQVGTLPLAEQQLVEICRAVRREPRLLILDEPTSALAAAEVDTVLEAVRRIAEGGVAVLYVSHRLDEIRRVARTATVMRDGEVVGTVDMATTSTEDAVAMMLGSAYEGAVRPQARAVDHGTTPLLSVSGLSVPPKVADVSFDLYPGEILGLAGLMGSGRTEVLRAVAGFEPAAAGTVRVDGREVPRVTAAGMKRRGVGLTPEDRKSEAIVPLLGVGENMVISDFRAVSSGTSVVPARIDRAARGLIERLSIATTSARTPIGVLSGGNQQKAVIGRWLHAGSRILLLDEPTRGVDVEAKEGIYRLVRELAAKGAAVLFVSGELEELPLVCDRVIALRGGTVAAEFTGDEVTVDAVLSAAMAA
ncbi:monosaccharide ABC transporter ATP-binding protein, CUT2 family [Actinomadura madurae]|uniref:Monosaccharide ABC transporter ATP-binding protein, CUT2 family n=1 Tax=Actinomadura madurae TaxID=1993 RepID=A0A1I4Y0R2_9ACTN|nr:sugar ABC transporter ATP-binding protein [Actinomadura madurae]SFN31637.1 monosaccharide ABC transporter ATP-binding protein, CUT2 family [Actinomadura madurae]